MTTPSKPQAVDLSNYHATVARLAEAREQLKAWEEIANEEKAIILSVLEKGTGLVRGIPAVSVTEQTRRGLDTERLRIEYPEIFAEFQKETTYKVVRVL